MTPILVVVALTGTGLLAYRLTSFFSRSFTKMGVTGIDVHKLDKPVRAEMGGLAVLISLFFGSGVLFFFDGEKSFMFIAGVGTICLAGLVGAFDDHFEMRQRYKVLLMAAASIPLSVSLLGRTSVDIPIIGTIPLGLTYPVLVVPLALCTSANFSNMLAGFNGLEVGLGSISMATLSFLSFAKGIWDGAILALLLLFAYLGFLTLNWYPARIFPGDSGTLIFGTATVTIGLISHLEFAAVVLSMPAAIDFALKMLSKKPFAQRRLFGNTEVNTDGELRPPSYPALAHAFMKVAPTRERTLVVWILAMEGLYAILAVVLTLFHV